MGLCPSLREPPPRQKLPAVKFSVRGSELHPYQPQKLIMDFSLNAKVNFLGGLLSR